MFVSIRNSVWGHSGKTLIFRQTNVNMLFSLFLRALLKRWEEVSHRSLPTICPACLILHHFISSRITLLILKHQKLAPEKKAPKITTHPDGPPGRPPLQRCNWKDWAHIPQRACPAGPRKYIAYHGRGSKNPSWLCGVRMGSFKLSTYSSPNKFIEPD